jgi:hypothetical protein
MIFYGVRKNKIAEGKIDSECGNCNKKTEFIYQITSNYCHFFFIPTIPFGKQTNVICVNCREIYNESEIDNSLKKELSCKYDSKTPKWQWTGSLIFILFIFLMSWNSKEKNDKIQKIFENPRKNDIYEIKVFSDQFTLMKIDSVKSNSIIFIKSKYSSNLLSGLDGLLKKGNENWSLIKIEVPKKTIDSLMINESIKNIRR